MRESVDQKSEEVFKSKEITEFNQNAELEEPMDEEMKEILELLGEIPQVPVPASFDLNFRRGLKKEKEKRKTVLYKRWASIAAVCVVGVASILIAQDGFSVFPNTVPMEQAKENDEEHSISMTEEGMNRQKDPKKSIPEATDKAGENSDLPKKEEPKPMLLADMTKSGTDWEAGKGTENKPEQPTNQSQPANKPEQSTNQPQPANKPEQSTNQSQPANKPEQPTNQSQPTNEAQQLKNKPQSVRVYATGSGQQPDHGDNRNRTAYQSMNDLEQMATEEAYALSDIITSGQTDRIRGLRTDMTEEMAVAIQKLYDDLFHGTVLSMEKIEGKSLTGINQWYMISGNGKDIQVEVRSDGVGGLVMHEPILDHGMWLTEQLKGCHFTLLGYSVSEKDDAITFDVHVSSNEKKQPVDEVRSMTWKKTAS